MSDIFHVLLEAEPCLEGNVADGIFHAMFWRGGKLHGSPLDMLESLEKFLPQ
jgi:hypothetical protein